MPKISINIPVYNSEKYLEEAINSIINQDFSDFECLFCDDAGTDNSFKILQEFAKKDQRIKIFRNTKNQWIPKTRNFLATNSIWKYIAIFDSDDISEYNRLSLQYNFLEKNPDIWLCGTNFWILKGDKKFLRNPPCTDPEIKDSLFIRNPFWQNTVMIRRELFEKIWWYNEKFDVSEDLELWSRLYFVTKFANLEEALVSYRIHNQNSIITKTSEILKNTHNIHTFLIKNNYKMSIKKYIFYYIFALGAKFPFLWKYLIHAPQFIIKFGKKLKFFK